MAATTSPLQRSSSSPVCGSITPATSITLPVSTNYAAVGSSFIQTRQSRNLRRQARLHQHGGSRGCRELITAPVATMAPPAWPPVNPDTSQTEGEPSVGMEEVLKQDGGEEKLEVQEEESKEAPFVWRDHWYLVSLIEDLDASRPIPFQLLGRELVVWQDKQGEWRVFLDKCPHRLAPLSVSLCSSPISSMSLPCDLVC